MLSTAPCKLIMRHRIRQTRRHGKATTYSAFALFLAFTLMLATAPVVSRRDRSRRFNHVEGYIDREGSGWAPISHNKTFQLYKTIYRIWCNG